MVGSHEAPATAERSGSPINPYAERTSFANGDRVRLALPLGGRAVDPVGTVVATISTALADGSNVQDVMVLWDTGLEAAVAPDHLRLVTSRG